MMRVRPRTDPELTAEPVATMTQRLEQKEMDARAFKVKTPHAPSQWEG